MWLAHGPCHITPGERAAGKQGKGEVVLVLNLRYSSNILPALAGGSDQPNAPAALPRERAPVTTGKEVGWAPETAQTLKNREKSISLPGIEPRQSSTYPVAIPNKLS